MDFEHRPIEIGLSAQNVTWKCRNHMCKQHNERSVYVLDVTIHKKRPVAIVLPVHILVHGFIYFQIVFVINFLFDSC